MSSTEKNPSLINQYFLFDRKSKKDASKKLTSMINSDDDNSEKENVANDADDVFV